MLLLLFGFERSLKILSLNELVEPRIDGESSAVSRSRDLSAVSLSRDLLQWRERGLYFQRAAKVVPNARCLARAMALCHWARQCSTPAVLVIGVQRTADKTLAHAWSVICDEVVDDCASTIANFTVVYRC